MDNGILPFLPPMDRTAVLQAGNGNGPAQLKAWYLSGSCRPVLRLVYNFFSDGTAGTNLWKSEGDAAKRPSINSVTNGGNTGFKSIYGNYGIYGREKTGSF